MDTKLQRLRKENGWKSARSFAAHMGYSASTYTAYEQGDVSMSLERACEIADVLGCTLDELADRDADTNPVLEDITGACRSMDNDIRDVALTVARALSQYGR